MNIFFEIKKHLAHSLEKSTDFGVLNLSSLEVSLNLGKEKQFGDINCNGALIAAHQLKTSPRLVAEKIVTLWNTDPFIMKHCHSIQIAGPGFINLFLNEQAWQAIAHDFFKNFHDFFTTNVHPKKYLIEFVSANPTGPLTLGHGRNGIIGDVLARVLSFLGHKVTKEFYINDAGNQVIVLGESFKIRCYQALGREEQLPENSYGGDYLVTLAAQCVAEYGTELFSKPQDFFEEYAKKHMLVLIKEDLAAYNIAFDEWFSEKTLHQNGSIPKALAILTEKNLTYEQDGALWFKSTEFGDDKDRVIRKSDGTFTYITPDIAYHKNKFDRGYDIIIDIVGQDHHSYVKRLKATMEALGYSPDRLALIVYQLVSIKKGDIAVRMSKRAGTFTALREIIDTVGVDVARFFYLNRKAEAHLEFDLETALKHSEENPAFYVQYAFVRIKSVIEKALTDEELARFITHLTSSKTLDSTLVWKDEEIIVIKKMMSLHTILSTIEHSYQTHLIAYYAFELAHTFHTYYAVHRIINLDETITTKQRLSLVCMVQETLELCLDLLGLSKPEKM